ncbi:MAG: hypothetical protein AAF499_15525 [Pseudomonadota bacterium]
MPSHTRIAVLAVALVAGLQLHAWLRSDSPACVDAGDDLQLCVLSDMQKLGRHQRPVAEHADFDLTGDQPIRLHSARNETVAIQLLLRTRQRDPQPVSISWDPFVNSAGDATEQPELRLFQAHYHRVSNGGYRAA